MWIKYLSILTTVKILVSERHSTLCEDSLTKYILQVFYLDSQLTNCIFVNVSVTVDLTPRGFGPGRPNLLNRFGRTSADMVCIASQFFSVIC